MRSLKLCMVASELAPLAKTGGLADVSAALSVYLHRRGHDIRVLIPSYSTILDAGIETRPIKSLQNVSVDVGSRKVRFSISAAELPGSDLTVHLVDCPQLYHRGRVYTADPDEHVRFIVLARAAFEMCQRLQWGPEVFHCNDWHTALIPLYLRTLYNWDKLFARSKTLLAIHNIGHQGIVGANAITEIGLADSAHLFHQEDLQQGRINFLKTGVLYADVLTTVSPTYAKEIQTDEYGMGMQGLLRSRSETLVGILNGVDYGEWDPETDELIPYKYSATDLTGKEKNKKAVMQNLGLSYEEGVPLVGMVARLGWQKGISLIQAVVPSLLARRRFSFAVLGSGEAQYEQFFTLLQQRFRGRVCFYKGFSNELAHRIEAGSDMFLMPSAYEPCGLNQMYSLKYGTVPIVRQTGGLADSVILFDPRTQEGTGIVFSDFNAQALEWAIQTALDLYQDRETWRKLMENGMEQDFSWETQGALYEQLYEQLSGPV